jgi:hypothetical protein
MKKSKKISFITASKQTLDKFHKTGNLADFFNDILKDLQIVKEKKK